MCQEYTQYNIQYGVWWVVRPAAREGPRGGGGAVHGTYTDQTSANQVVVFGLFVQSAHEKRPRT